MLLALKRIMRLSHDYLQTMSAGRQYISLLGNGALGLTIINFPEQSYAIRLLWRVT